MVVPDELADLISARIHKDGSHQTAVPGMYLTRWSSTRVPRQTGRSACLCVVVQGAKQEVLADRIITYGASQYFISAMPIPSVSRVVQASVQRPLLCVTLLLDKIELSSLTMELGLKPPVPMQPAMTTSRQVDDIIDAITRLIRLLSSPSQVAILAPLIRRELLCRLLLGPNAGMLRQMALTNGKTLRLSGAIEFLGRHIDRRVSIQELAREVGMSAATMNRWFHVVTSMTPLQFHKRLRLQQARAIMLSDGLDTATAGQAVGYVSLSQFSRDYRGLFGASPLRDIRKIRELQIASLAGVVDSETMRLGY